RREEGSQKGVCRFRRAARSNAFDFENKRRGDRDTGAEGRRGMKVAIGDRTFDARDVPIVLILEPEDKTNIGNMLPECRYFCAAPSSTPDVEIRAWIRSLKEQENGE